METIQGRPVSAGFAVGPVYVYRTEVLECPRSAITRECVASEKEKVHRALACTQRTVKGLIAHSVDSGTKESYAIFEGYLEIVTDRELEKDLTACIENELVGFDTAVCEVSKQYVEDMLAIDDPYLQARAEDFRQIFRMIKTAASDTACGLGSEQKPFVLAAEEIGPADMETMDKSLLLGILVESGSRTSHAAILSRSLGIPMISGIQDICTRVKNGVLSVVDGGDGVVFTEPSAEIVNSYTAKIEITKTEKESCRIYLDRKIFAADGTPVALYANIGSEDDLPEVLANNADGIGLFRTEFMFMKNGGTVLPSENVQFEVYRHVLEKMDGKPVVFRTLDAGGDKNIAALHIPGESNPFLGLRAIRYCLRHEDVFLTQLRAILRAAAYGNARIMLPMIISTEEIRQTKKLIKNTVLECRRAGVPVSENVPLGVMIETPAAAVTAADLAREADFFSIGTNDLTQYTLAVDRGNETIADLYDEAHPAVLALIKHVIECADEAGIPVDVCGEMAGNPAFTERLLQAGLREFSMSAIHILKIKRKIAEL